MKLSVAIICRNEESCIETLLKSVKDADEIVVADTGSEDKTLEIVRKYTDKIFTDYKWEDSFEKARNYVKNKCIGDWILSIDCDEVLEEGGIDKIRKAIEVAEKKKFKTVNVMMVDDTAGRLFYFPRVFKKCPEVKWCGDIHNYLNVSEPNDSDIKIYYSYSDAHAKDPDRTLRIAKKSVEANPKLCREKFYLAREYWYRNDYITAIYWYQEYLKVAWWGAETAEAYLMLARCHWYLHKGEQARDYCLQAIKINANFEAALNLMAEMSGPGNAKRWNEFARTATNEGVLFPDHKRLIEVCLVVYNRLELLPQQIEDLKKQNTENFNLHIWNNSGKPISVDFPSDRLRIVNSETNIGSQARFKLAEGTKDDVIVFIDDDERFDPDFLRYYYDQHLIFGNKAILGWHTRKFSDKGYWSADRNAKYGEEVDYIGTGGMILNKKILEDQRLQNIPEYYNKVEDLYLSFLAKSKGYKLIKIEPHCIIIEDGKDQYNDLWEYKERALTSLYADFSSR